MVPLSKFHVCLLTAGRIFEVQYGSDKFTVSLARWLSDRGFDVTLMGPTFASVKVQTFLEFSETNAAATKESKELKAIHPPYAIWALSRLFLSFRWVLSLLMLNWKHPLTLIHAQDAGYAGLAAVTAGRILGIPVMISSHGNRYEAIDFQLRGRFRRFFLALEYRLDLFTVKNATKVIAVNQSIKDYFEARANIKVDFIPVPIRVKEFSFSEIERNHVRTELGLDKNEIVIGYIGRLSSEKNVATLLKSFAIVKQEHKLGKLLLVGDGSQDNELREFTKKNGIYHDVIFCGRRNDIRSILSAIDIFVLVSYTEGMSLALLEAMASGRAIICSDIPANRGLLSSDDALFVSPNDPETLARLIRSLFNNRELRSRLAERAISKSKCYDESMVFPQIIQSYKDVLMV